MLKRRQTQELYRTNKDGETQHILHEGPYPTNFRSNCWCEPRHVYTKNLRMYGKQYKGWWKIVLHDGPWSRATFPPTNIVDRLYNTLREPPDGGWSAVMDNEDVESLIEDVLSNGWKVPKKLLMRQRKNEPMHDFVARIKAALDSGVDEIDFETEDSDALHQLLQRDDDFEVETDEEE